MSSSTSNHSPCGKKFRGGLEHGPVVLEARNSKTTTATGLTNGQTLVMETAQVDSDKEYL